MPHNALVINSLGGRHTQTCTHTDVRTESILRNQACASHKLARAWFKNLLKWIDNTIITL